MAIKKKSFADIKNKHSKVASYKPQTFFDLGPDFLDACGLPGPAMGQLNMFLGHTDTGKTTAMVKAIVDAQKKNILPVIIITEQKWSFEHAKLMGMECESTVDKETGDISWDGFFLFRNDFDTIEQITDFINDLLNDQDKGEIEYDLQFVWDSVGSIPCQMTFEGKGGKEHNAATLANKIGMGLNQRITGSRRSESKYTNTLIIVNQPWVDRPDNPFTQPRIKAKGGESIWLNSALVFLFGNQKNSGINKISITKDGRKTKLATWSKISILKNHINGLGYEDGKIVITAHGFMGGKDTVAKDKSIAQYKKEHMDYITDHLGVKVTDADEIEVVTDVEPK